MGDAWLYGSKTSFGGKGVCLTIWPNDPLAPLQKVSERIWGPQGVVGGIGELIWYL